MYSSCLPLLDFLDDFCYTRCMSVRILKFKLSNFKSFLDESELSFSSTESTSRQINAFFGPNASGKSNIASALKIFRIIVKSSTNSGFKLPYFPFAFRDDSKKRPTFFSVEFLRNNFIFQFFLFPLNCFFPIFFLVKYLIDHLYNFG